MRIPVERRRPGRLRSVSAERMGNDGDARSQARGGGGGRPSSGKTTRTSRSKKDKLQKAMRDMELERGEDNGSWLTEELLMLFEDEDGEFLNFTPSVRSRVTLASKKVRKKGNVRPPLNARASSTTASLNARASSTTASTAVCVCVRERGGEAFLSAASPACFSRSLSRALGCAPCL